MAEDIINKPSHYTHYKIEPVTFGMVNDLKPHAFNIVKYVCRGGHKLYPGMDEVESEIVDLKKVIRYAEMRINMLEGKDVL